jgi:hypothetical protein
MNPLTASAIGVERHGFPYVGADQAVTATYVHCHTPVDAQDHIRDRIVAISLARAPTP